MPDLKLEGYDAVMKKKIMSLALAFVLASTACGGTALAYVQPEAASAAGTALHCHGGGHHSSRGHHGKAETCDWLFHTYGKCKDVYCEDEDHNHRCPADCEEDHWHYSVCHYADGTLELMKRKV